METFRRYPEANIQVFRKSLVLCAIVGMGFNLSADDHIDFNKQIRPLLATHCLTCHGPDESTREAGFRLDRRDSAVAEADSGEFPIVSGKPLESELIRRIRLPLDDSERMPPTGKGLTEQESKLLEEWISRGAEYAKHWSFVPPERPRLPETDANWAKNAIDAFVLKKLKSAGLSPTSPAKKYVIVRRVYLDLTGIPPTLEEADQFVNDTSPNAYEKMVDRALASPNFGERWARVWLDLARYADSQGYAQDSPRRIYRYRDWVIKAINDNLPFDQFSIEQIAGDMLDQPTNDQIIATGFHRNTMTNSEGGTDDEEFRNAAVVDRVNTTLEVWMGMTMGCAQCHTHKYDPITQEEYFQVFAILNQTEDADRGNEAPLHAEFSKTRLRLKQQLETQIEQLERKIAQQPIGKKPTLNKSLPSGPLKPRYIRIQGLGKMFLHLAEVQTFAGETNLALKGKARQSSTDFDGPAHFGNDGNTDGDFAKKSVTHSAEELNPWWEVDLGSPQTISRVVVWNRTDNPGVRDRLKSFRVILLDANRQPIWTTTTQTVPNPSHSFNVPAEAKSITKSDRKLLTALLSETATPQSPSELKLKELQNKLAKISQPDITTPIMRELPKDKQRTTKIHIRGNFRNQGKQVAAGVPKVFHPIVPRNKTVDRLDLAKWLVSPENPVTARVVVNRYWEHLFGLGIVETSEDFGTQGEPPSHPLLLDYLATDFVESGWDVKRLLKKIVCSSTYRQSSKVSPALEKLDPRNRLLARGPRVRLPAEMIRDQALFVSGSLSHKMNGPSVRPPRPKLGLRAAFGGSTDWDPSPGEDALRRGLYTTWRRTSPYPSMTTFDAPSREFCTIRRSRTNTPLQALVTLNDPVFVDAARSLAKQTLRIADNEQTRIRYLFRRVLIRPPSDAEVSYLLNTLNSIQNKLQPDNAKLLAGKHAVDQVGPVEFASWVVMGNIVLNLDETLARP